MFEMDDHGNLFDVILIALDEHRVQILKSHPWSFTVRHTQPP